MVEPRLLELCGISDVPVVVFELDVVSDVFDADVDVVCAGGDVVEAFGEKLQAYLLFRIKLNTVVLVAFDTKG